MGYKEATTPKSISERHRALMRELIAGATHKEAAARTGFTPERVSQLSQSELFQSEMQQLREQVEGQFVKDVAEDPILHIRSKLEDEVENSINTLINLRDRADSEAVRAKTAVELLDRAGVKPPTKIEARVLNLDVNEGLALLLRDLKEVLTKASDTNMDLEEMFREDYDKRSGILAEGSG